MGRLVQAAFLLLAFVDSASGTPPIIVSQDGTGDFTEIQPAIDAAAARDEGNVLVLPGEYLIREPCTAEEDKP